MIFVTEKAREKITDLLIDENNPNVFFRTYIQGGGCAGMQYGFTFDQELNQDDYQIDIDVFKIVVDSISMQYLQNSTLDYKEELMSSRFVIINPNIQTSCGCGSSFSIS